MNSHFENESDIELAEVETETKDSHKLTLRALKKGIRFVENLRAKVKSNWETETKLDEIKSCAESLHHQLCRVDQSDPVIQQSIQDILNNQFERLAVALLKKPNQFQLFNQENYAFKSFEAICTILNTWDKFLKDNKPNDISEYKTLDLQP